MNGLLVIAENQTKGRGTNGRNWFVREGENLTFSFYLRPNCNIRKLKSLTIRIAEVMVGVIKDLYGYCLDIKYPNDIMLFDKKIRWNTHRKLYNW